MLDCTRLDTVLGTRSTLEASTENRNLLNQMFWDRRVQFCEEFGWDLHVDEHGREIDQFDALEVDPVYVILKDHHGTHRGSGRLMPMSGPNMLQDVFGNLLPADFAPAPGALEVTRVFVPQAQLTLLERMYCTCMLMLDGINLARAAGAPELWGCTYPSMVRVFRMAGWPVNVHWITDLSGFGATSICRWPVTTEIRDAIEKRATALHKNIEYAATKRDFDFQDEEGTDG